jgi:hypothetical protein
MGNRQPHLSARQHRCGLTSSECRVERYDTGTNAEHGQMGGDQACGFAQRDGDTVTGADARALEGSHPA